MPRKPKDIVAFGDFQTPDALALQATQLLVRLGVAPSTIIEPTCGVGAFVAAAAAVFPTARVLGFDINADHLAIARTRRIARTTLEQGDFFALRWGKRLRDLPEPWLILGNPPWVTVAGLTAAGGDNAPARDNATGLRGIDALTGRSNFDISEWMIREYLRWLADHTGTIAVLCKTAVARKVLAAAWEDRCAIIRARLFAVDAMAAFGAAVDAGLLVIETGSVGATVCDVYQSLDVATPTHQFGYADGHVIADVPTFTALSHLRATTVGDDWRSGIKHDCAAVMELTRTHTGYRNGLGEEVQLEAECLYPLLKSSDVAHGRNTINRMMLVPQRFVGDDTARLRDIAPRTWDYLNHHAARLQARKSAIYRGRPPFAIFGVGPYTFVPWKVAISGLYKRLAFACVGPVGDKPIVFDDTVAFLACPDEADARAKCALLNSAPAQRFLSSMIFWPDKRPITTALLRRLSLAALANEGRELDPLLERQRA